MREALHTPVWDGESESAPSIPTFRESGGLQQFPTFTPSAGKSAISEGEVDAVETTTPRWLKHSVIYVVPPQAARQGDLWEIQ